MGSNPLPYLCMGHGDRTGACYSQFLQGTADGALPGNEGKQLLLAQQKPSAMPRKGSSDFPTLGIPN